MAKKLEQPESVAGSAGSPGYVALSDEQRYRIAEIRKLRIELLYLDGGEPDRQAKFCICNRIFHMLRDTVPCLCNMLDPEPCGFCRDRDEPLPTCPLCGGVGFCRAT